MATQTELRPGEIVLTNRVRMCHPAAKRDSLPSTDEALCTLICKAAGLAHLSTEAAKDWCRTHIMQEMAEWDEVEQNMALNRMGTLWSEN